MNIIEKNKSYMRYDSNGNFINTESNTIWDSPGIYEFMPDGPRFDTTGSLNKYPYCMLRAPHEYYALYHLARSVPKNGNIIEIGTAWGGTSALMSTANPTAKIKTYDPFQLPDEWTNKWTEIYGRDWSYESTQDFLKDFPNIIAIKGSSPNIDMSSWEYNSIDMLFEDANHSFFPTILNLLFLIPYVKKGGIISGHDYNTGFPGVVDAVNLAHSIFGRKTLFLCDSLWFFYKK